MQPPMEKHPALAIRECRITTSLNCGYPQPLGCLISLRLSFSAQRWSTYLRWCPPSKGCIQLDSVINTTAFRRQPSMSSLGRGAIPNNDGLPLRQVASMSSLGRGAKRNLRREGRCFAGSSACGHAWGNDPPAAGFVRPRSHFIFRDGF